MLTKFALIFLLLFSCPILTAEELTNLTTTDVSNKLTQNALVIDIRTPQEWQRTGIITGSQPVNFFDRNGKHDVDLWLAQVKQLQTSPDQEIILVCGSGGRSEKAGNLLSQQLNMPNISHLSNGISLWIKENRPTDKVCTATQTC